ncbi:hypothetical protein QQ045_028880 [Rhodiola kirilowii]
MQQGRGGARRGAVGRTCEEACSARRRERSSGGIWKTYCERQNKYVSVETSELFYYFIESEGNPKKDPLLLWYSGGPGCSALNGLIYEIGPLAFNVSAYDGGIPPISYYPYSWTKSSSILFVDAPVGTGFSYATDPSAYPTSDTKSTAQTYAFLRQWLIYHPQFLKNQLFIGADSYSGISATLVVQHVVNGNIAGTKPYLNLKGYIVGCPRTDAIINENSVISFLTPNRPYIRPTL